MSDTELFTRIGIAYGILGAGLMAALWKRLDLGGKVFFTILFAPLVFLAGWGFKDNDDKKAHGFSIVLLAGPVFLLSVSKTGTLTDGGLIVGMIAVYGLFKAFHGDDQPRIPW